MLSKGMYVSCPITKNGVEIHILGKIINYNKTLNEVEVVFYDQKNMNSKLRILNGFHKTYFEFEVKRAFSIFPVNAVWKDISVNIICDSGAGGSSLFSYTCLYRREGKLRWKTIPESELLIDFYNIRNSAADEAIHFENSEPELFYAHQVLSKRKAYINSFEDIILSLINTRVYLYPHQIDTVIRATNNNYTRVMLSDEVGLGKTIEALTILKYYMYRSKGFRCIIVVPTTLEYQWFNEINDRFEIDADIFSLNKILQKKTKASVFVISYGDYYRQRYDIKEMKWDMIIIDEAHKILKSRYFSTLLRATKTIRNVLLLSATPISYEGIEHLQLLKMLEPNKYKSTDVEQFKKSISVQRTVNEYVDEIDSNLEFYDEESVRDSVISDFQELNEKLSDSYLKRIIEEMSETSGDNGLYAVDLAMKYLKDQYVVDSKVIRHRRAEVKEADIKRNLNRVITYEMEGGEFEVYESALYDSLLELAIKSVGVNDKEKWVEIMEAMLSSPYALLPHFTAMEIPGNEKRPRFVLLQKWKKFCDAEINRLIEGDSYHFSRFRCLIDAIDHCEGNKILIFSNFKETAKIIHKLLQGKYGRETSVLFVSEMTRLESQLAARGFQKEDKCRFIVCDKSGGEGKNFQEADFIIHFDLSWSPNMMEQRIGRLDRIGREVNRSVESIVIFAEKTIESKLFDIYKKVLGVFSKSLCGLEIILDDIQVNIANAFTNQSDLESDEEIEEINKKVKETNSMVEEEIYFYSNSIKHKYKEDYTKKISSIFESENEIETEDEILCWLQKCGIPTASRNEKTGLLTIDFSKAKPDLLRNNLFYEAFTNKKYIGTFRRKIAIEQDSIDYFSPNHVLYKMIINQIDRKQSGRFVALSATNDVRWAGFIFVWNIEINKMDLLREGLNPQKYKYLKKYLSEQQVVNSFRVYGNENLNEIEVLSALTDKKNTVLHNIEDTVGYERFYEEDSWEEFVNKALDDAKKRAKQSVLVSMKTDELENSLREEGISGEIEKKTIHNLSAKRLEKDKAIMAALLHSTVTIDSILYAEV